MSQAEIAQGWLLTARHCPSPNYDQRPSGQPPELIVIHCISLPPGQYGAGQVDELFCNRLDPNGHSYFAGIADLRVSAHFLIDRHGSLTQYVSCDQRAWHAGKSQWRGRERCNDFSIGIELEGSDSDIYTEPQYMALAELIQCLLHHYPELRPWQLAGHDEIAPGRKTDPGPGFDWARLCGLLGVSPQQRLDSLAASTVGRSFPASRKPNP